MMKPDIARFRVARWRFRDGSVCFTVTADTPDEADAIENDESFDCWLTDWQEVEVKASE